jgi:hypothetical protein
MRTIANDHGSQSAIAVFLRFLYSLLHGPNQNRTSHPSAQLLLALPMVSVMVKQIGEEIVLSCRTAATKADLERSVQAYQAGLTDLLDPMAACQQRGPLFNRSLAGASDELGKMLEYLRKNYPGCWDNNARVPISWLAPALVLLRSSWHRLKVKLPLHTGNPVLSGIALGPVRQLLKGGNGPVSFAHLQYVQSLASQQEKLVDNPSNGLKEEQLRALLVGMNFNDRAFIGNEEERVQEELKSKATPEAKIGLLQYELKCMKQLHYLPGLAFCPGQQSVTAAMINWLNAELVYWENKPETILVSTDTGKIKERASCSQSIPVLAVTFRAGNETKFFDGKHAVTFRVVTNNFKCAYAPSISMDQFERDYKKPKPSTCRAAIRELKKMVEWLEKQLAPPPPGEEAQGEVKEEDWEE